MNIHEFQAKQILGRFGAPVPKGQPATSAAEIEAAFKALGQPKAVAKVQIHAGGRGKAGGVKLVSSAAEASEVARELYLAMLVDRKAESVAVIASTEGGMDIEEVAAKTPEKIITDPIDPVIGVAAFQARKIAFAL